ncbi:glyoxalase [Nocardioides sp. Root190]|uniref:VOC family protein n=1 Tax=Nocardioides sp. Root190 TaxID=1736488 RepID=UPI0006FE9729|nr:VOC family protein [Nocardioides sp. Root190]KRB77160.1 glyoxalase [Nocardioides sp. Root190]
MDQRISFLTLAVADLDATRRFYRDGLGWTPEVDVPGEVLMFRAGPQLVLSLWERSHFEGEVGTLMTGPGVAPITIAHNVADPAGVDEVLAAAEAAGSPHVQVAVQRDWGGYTGYFADPDGYRWEIAFNPDPGLAGIVLPD